MAFRLKKLWDKFYKEIFAAEPPPKIYTKEHNVAHLEVGDFTYGVPIIREWGEGKKVYIGKFCSIASYVQIFLGGNHRVDWISTYPFNALAEPFPNAIGIEGHPATNGNVIIGHDVWIGQGALILSGVKIGNGAVIGACTLVSKDVEPYQIVVGNPMKVVRKRFSDEVIQQLQQIAWWNWEIEKINQHVKILCSNDVEQLLKLANEKSI
jgi:virginiamycin A acetyltransferase